MLKTILSALRGPFRARKTSPRPTANRVLAAEPLGKREMCAVNIGYNPSNGLTTIEGSAVRDVIKVEPIVQNGNAMHRFTVDGVSYGTHPRGNQITANLGAGNDSLEALDVTVKMVVHAGMGDDYVRAGHGNDVLYGEAGRDNLRGTAGNDTLYGGDGNDVLVGGYGNDWFYGQLGADTVDMRDGNAKANGDVNVNPQVGIDTIQRDASQFVTPSAKVVNSHTNYVLFVGVNVDLNATESNNIYNADIDNHDYGLWRDDVGPTRVKSYNLAVDAVISDGDFQWWQLG